MRLEDGFMRQELHFKIDASLAPSFAFDDGTPFPSCNLHRIFYRYKFLDLKPRLSSDFGGQFVERLLL